MKPAGRRSTRRETVRVLFTCVGRRVELLNAFRKAGDQLSISLQVHGADVYPLSPGIQCVDKAHLVPPLKHRRYIDVLLDVVRLNRIDLLVPLIDPELPIVARSADRFAEAGCCALVSSPRVVEMCRDKLATFHALRAAGIDTPATWVCADAVARKRLRFPCFLKPRAGSAAAGSFVIWDREQLRTFGKAVTDPIVQEFVDGDEFTLDVYTGFDGRPRCVVPRKRLEVRNGEVSKALVVKDRAIMDVGHRVAELLGECRGVITVQCIVTPRRQIRVIEINPRFGGGVPLAIYAGANFPKWILAELLGRKPRIRPHGFRNDVAMLRFDDSVFIDRASSLVRSLRVGMHR